MDIAGIDLITATAQPVTVLRPGNPASGKQTYVFLKPDGMNPVFHFEEVPSQIRAAALFSVRPGRTRKYSM